MIRKTLEADRAGASTTRGIAGDDIIMGWLRPAAIPNEPPPT
jgi:hypothetical protein